jgi:hypothetical protein
MIGDYILEMGGSLVEPSPDCHPSPVCNLLSSVASPDCHPSPVCNLLSFVATPEMGGSLVMARMKGDYILEMDGSLVMLIVNIYPTVIICKIM